MAEVYLWVESRLGRHTILSAVAVLAVLAILIARHILSAI